MARVRDPLLFAWARSGRFRFGGLDKEIYRQYHAVMMLRRKRRARRTRQGSFDFDAGKHGGKREHAGRRGPSRSSGIAAATSSPAAIPAT